MKHAKPKSFTAQNLIRTSFNPLRSEAGMILSASMRPEAESDVNFVIARLALRSVWTFMCLLFVSSCSPLQWCMETFSGVTNHASLMDDSGFVVASTTVLV